MEHCAKLGLKGVTLNAFPSGQGLAAPEDDEFWAAAIDLDIAPDCSYRVWLPSELLGTNGDLST